MQWTTEIPTVEGFYWMRNFERYTVCEEEHDAGFIQRESPITTLQLIKWSLLKDGCRCGKHEETFLSYYIPGCPREIKIIKGEFFGPLEAPE
jgi:hypothetical protein